MNEDVDENADATEPEEPADPANSRAIESDQSSGGGWTLSILSVGLAIVAACVLIPQADANRRLMYEREKLFTGLQQIQKQVAVNKEFLIKVETDPQLYERLALRQMRVVRQGERVLDIKGDEADSDGPPMAGTAVTEAAQMSPFMIVHVPPPPPMPDYQPVGGILGEICLQPRGQLYLLGGGLFLIAVGLVLGDSAKPAAQPA